MLVTMGNAPLVEKLIFIAGGSIDLVQKAIRATADEDGALLEDVVAYIKAHRPPLTTGYRSVPPAYLLSNAQWQRLFDLYLDAFIVRRFESTMRVLERKHLVRRRETFSQWEITLQGRVALRSAPEQWRMP